MTRQRIAITGASGLIGGALSAHLRQRGDEVVPMVRRGAGAHEITWQPGQDLSPGALAGIDAVVHLAGAGVGDRRWTPAYKDLILRSRVDGTATISRAVAAADHPIRLVSGSAIGFYGSRGDEELDESSTPGDGFLAEVVRAWEAATAPAEAAGMPVTHARTGLVFSAHGGALGRMLPLARLGLAGPLGTGAQFWSWISLVDEVRALAFLVDRPDLTGPVNLAGPDPTRQRDVAEALGKLLKRPARLPAPAVALRLALGEFADDILASQRVVPQRLMDAGFVFTHPDLDAALDAALDAGVDRS